MSTLDVGIAFFLRNPPQWRIPFPDFYREKLAQIQLAEELGFDTAWIGEHHFSEDGYLPSPVPFLSAMATATRRIRIGTNVLLLPLHNAVRLGEDAALVDILSDGRLDLGLGQGYSVGEFKGYGVPLKERGSRYEEGVNVIRSMWEQDSFSFAGKHYQVENIRLNPKPVQRPHPPLWGGGNSDKAIDRIARLGMHLIGGGIAHTTQVYDEALRRHGRDPVDFQVAQNRFVHVAPTREQAWDEVQNHLHYMLSWYNRWLSEAKNGGDGHGGIPPMPSPSELRHLDAEMLGGPVIGSPAEVTRTLIGIKSEMRMTQLIATMDYAGMDAQVMRRSMELFAREVMPALR